METGFISQDIAISKEHQDKELIKILFNRGKISPWTVGSLHMKTLGQTSIGRLRIPTSSSTELFNTSRPSLELGGKNHSRNFSVSPKWPPRWRDPVHILYGQSGRRELTRDISSGWLGPII